ncbi:glycosyltransferase [Wenzhouxiangella limi]|uniref:Glycosyltransferase n=1 Tax=Wenzhouxiangella limi TaxID=2707351 RepID=A0A845UWS1_9GAMM|nr:glycosyltransferase [Wenzhouxiangella limi]NDY96303.1 glycosyltransferase [Wenzhouxiangella limi]
MYPVTAMVVAFDEEEWVYESIQSILPYVSEVVFVDDNSTDDTLDRVRSIKNEKVRVYCYEQHGISSLGDLKNFAQEKASNPWVIRWDADFIAYDHIGRLFSDIGNRFDSYLLSGPNLSGDINHQPRKRPEFGPELYLFRRGLVEFRRTDNFGDYPVVIKQNRICRNYGGAFWVHANNLKKPEKLSYRIYMSRYLASGTKEPYIDWVGRTIFKSEFSIDEIQNRLLRSVTKAKLDVIPFDFNKYGPHPEILLNSPSASKYSVG